LLSKLAVLPSRKYGIIGYTGKRGRRGMKKPWDKPNLIVLVRNRPEEAILNGCKGGISGGPGFYNYICTAYPFTVDPESEVLVPCPECSTYTAS
jgi:hypothetical protein